MIAVRILFHLFLSALALVAWPPAVTAHDPSAYGGLFRSRDQGATWLPANPGRIVSGALALAVSPTDSTHLLLATDSGLLRSRNGGLEWTLEAPSVLVGAVFAVTFLADGHPDGQPDGHPDGKPALASTGSAVFRTEDGQSWHAVPTPAEATPARVLLAAPGGRVYLAGWGRLYRSDDWGRSWSDAAAGLPDGPATALAISRGARATVYAVAGGRAWASTDAGHTWHVQDEGLPPGRVETLAVDASRPDRLWAVGGGQVFRSEDGGGRWAPAGRPLPEASVVTRGIAASAGSGAITLTTDRGLFRSADGGERWEQIVDNLPAHLEAWPLVRDPQEPDTLYAGFALLPYLELWRIAAEGGGSLGRLDPATLAGGVAFLVLLGLAATVALRRLARQGRRPIPSARRAPPDPPISPGPRVDVRQAGEPPR